MQSSLPRINESIRKRREGREYRIVSEVRLIGSDGEQIGVVSLDDALNRARQEQFDLVEVAPAASPPVCKIMDFGKYRYEIAKKLKESKKKQKTIVVKEVKFRPKIDIGDFNTKVKKIRQFIDEGNKVKVTIQFRGREVAYSDMGKEVLDRVVSELEGFAEVEKLQPLIGRQMFAIMNPVAGAAPKVRESGKKTADEVEPSKVD